MRPWRGGCTRGIHTRTSAVLVIDTAQRPAVLWMRAGQTRVAPMAAVSHRGIRVGRIAMLRRRVALLLTLGDSSDDQSWRGLVIIQGLTPKDRSFSECR